MKKAAEAGNVNAMKDLSELYRDGIGTDVNISQYHYWQGKWKQSQQ